MITKRVFPVVRPARRAAGWRKNAASSGGNSPRPSTERDIASKDRAPPGSTWLHATIGLTLAPPDDLETGSKCTSDDIGPASPLNLGKPPRGDISILTRSNSLTPRPGNRTFQCNIDLPRRFILHIVEGTRGRRVQTLLSQCTACTLRPHLPPVDKSNRKKWKTGHRKLDMESRPIDRPQISCFLFPVFHRLLVLLTTLPGRDQQRATLIDCPMRRHPPDRRGGP